MGNRENQKEGETMAKAFPKEVENLENAYRIIGKPKGGRKIRVLHNQQSTLCLNSKMYWYERDYPGAIFQTLEPGEKIPKTLTKGV